MSYVSLPELRAILNPQGETTGTAAALSDTVLQSLIASAQAEVDSTLGWLYITPFNPVPEMVQTITTDIAAFLADSTYRKGVDYSAETLEPVVMRYRRAIDMLKRIAAGEMMLAANAVFTPAQASGPKVLNSYQGSLFGIDDFNLVEESPINQHQSIQHPFSPWG